MKRTCTVAAALSCVLIAAAPNETRAESRDGYWSADGRTILFVSDRGGVFQLYAMNADGSDQRRITDNEVPFFYPSYSPDGSKIVLMSYEDRHTAAVWTLNVDGTDLRRLTDVRAFNADPNWTADGRHIVFHTRDANTDAIFIMNADGSGRRPLIVHEADEYTPVPSPNGAHLALVSDRGGAPDIWLFGADGSNPRNLTNDPEWNGVPRWTADSSAVLYYTKLEEADGGGSDLFRIDVESGQRVRLTETSIPESGPILSPQGERICFTAKGADGKQIWVMNADGSDRRCLTCAAAPPPAPASDR